MLVVLTWNLKWREFLIDFDWSRVSRSSLKPCFDTGRISDLTGLTDFSNLGRITSERVCSLVTDFCWDRTARRSVIALITRIFWEASTRRSIRPVVLKAVFLAPINYASILFPTPGAKIFLPAVVFRDGLCRVLLVYLITGSFTWQVRYVEPTAHFYGRPVNWLNDFLVWDFLAWFKRRGIHGGCIQIYWISPQADLFTRSFCSPQNLRFLSFG